MITLKDLRFWIRDTGTYGQIHSVQSHDIPLVFIDKEGKELEISFVRNMNNRVEISME